MSTMTLEELKRQNEELETETEDAPQADAVEVDDEAVEDDDDTDGDAETLEGSDDSDAEAWMLSDGQASQDSVPLHAHTKLRAKLKAKLGEKEDELSKLRAEIEAIKNQSTSKPQATAKRPRLEDFDYDEDRYNDAMDSYYISQMESKLSAAEQQKQQAALQSKTQAHVEKAVDEHYQRAAELVERSGIAPDLYQTADQSFREVIENALPQKGLGDVVAEAMIARIGKGSEKVVYAFGRNATLKSELAQSLRDDPTGIQAAILLGRKAAEFELPQKKTTRAPAPAARAEGGSGGVSTDAAKLAKKYKEASKSGDMQAAFDARRAAKKAGIDISQW